MSDKDHSSGEQRAVSAPQSDPPRATPRPRSLSPSRGTETARGVERHSRIIAKRSSINPAVITIVALGILGFIGIIAYSAMSGERRPPPPRRARPATPRVHPEPAVPTATPATPPTAAAPTPVARPATPPVRTRRPVAGALTGTITPEGRDTRTFSWSCPCGGSVQQGDATCSACSAKLQWPASIPCPYCHTPRGSGVCALCRGGEPRRMMGMVIRCPLCDGTKKCARCKGTGALAIH